MPQIHGLMARFFRPARFLFFALTLGLATLCPSMVDGASRKPQLTVRFHVEVSATNRDPFSIPIKLPSPPRNIFIESSSSLSERQVEFFNPFPAGDGTWGGVFHLNPSGRLTLSNLTSSNRGRSLVFYLGNEKLSRLVLDIYIDGTVSDGVLPIRRGLTWQEAELLKNKFPAPKSLRQPE